LKTACLTAMRGRPAHSAMEKWRGNRAWGDENLTVCCKERGLIKKPLLVGIPPLLAKEAGIMKKKRVDWEGIVTNKKKKRLFG